MAAGTAVPDYPAPARLERCLDLLFPPTCVGCRRIGRWICCHCWPQVPWILRGACSDCGRPMFAPFCLHCSRQSGPLDDLIAVAHFEGIAREAVHVLKYHGRHAIAGLMGRLMAGVAREVEVDCVAPIPLHSTRLRERGYDQAALLARSVAHALALPHQGKALKRVRATRQQVTLDALARQANVAGAFASPRAWDGERILLIDDVSTTGATMRSAAGALKASGAGAIVGLVFARADG